LAFLEGGTIMYTAGYSRLKDDVLSKGNLVLKFSTLYSIPGIYRYVYIYDSLYVVVKFMDIDLHKGEKADEKIIEYSQDKSKLLVKINNKRYLILSIKFWPTTPTLKSLFRLIGAYNMENVPHSELDRRLAVVIKSIYSPENPFLVYERCRPINVTDFLEMYDNSPEVKSVISGYYNQISQKRVDNWEKYVRGLDY
jgi:hypothetical protein